MAEVRCEMHQVSVKDELLYAFYVRVTIIITCTKERGAR